jgi:hypothetical protein
MQPLARVGLLAALPFAGACEEGLDFGLRPELGRTEVLQGAQEVTLLAPALPGMLRWQPEPDGTVAARRASLPGMPVASWSRAGTGVAVLVADPAALVWWAEGADRATTVRLPGAFDALSVDAEGGALVAWHRPGSEGAGRSVLFNPNEMVWVDLASLGSAAPVVRPLVLTGPRPQALSFAPAFSLGGDPLRYLAVLAQGTVSFVDPLTDDEDNRQRLVRLVDPSQERGVVPTEVVFSEDDPSRLDDMKAWVIVPGSRDLYVIDLLPGVEEQNRVLQPSINLVAVGGVLTSVVPFSLDGRRQLLVTTQSSAAALVDAETNQISRVAMPPGTGRAMVYDRVEEGQVRPWAVFWSPGAAVLHFGALDQLQVQGSGALRPREVGGVIDTLSPLPGSPDTALLTYRNGLGFGIVRLASRTEVPVPARVSLGAFVASGDVVLAPVRFDRRIVLLDTRTGATGEVELDHATERLVLLQQGAVVAAWHGQDRWSFLRTATLEDGAFAFTEGLLLDGLLDAPPGGTR